VFGAVLQMADRGEVRGLIVVQPNRVSRNHADSGAFVQRLVEGTIASLDTTGGKRYTGADSNDIFMLTLEGAMSWKDSRDKGDRTLQAMRMRAAEGKHMGQVRLGYRRVYRPDGTWVVEQVPEVAPLVRRLFERAADGTCSVQGLTAEAARLGLRSRTGRELLKATVHTMLRDPLYKGYVRFDGIVARGQHEPIVGEALWERVQGVLSDRRTSTARPKEAGLRELFVFGNLLRCPRCGRALSPYRVKGKYVYYECKNPHARCGVLVAQAKLAGQLPPLLDGLTVPEADRGRLRGSLIEDHRRRAGDEAADRKGLASEYERVMRELGDVFAQRKEAEALGVLDAVDLRLAGLRARRDELQARLNAARNPDESCADRVVRCFELFELLREAIICGSRHPRELALRAVSSNWTVEGEKLVPKLRSPFRQRAQEGGHPRWLPGLYDVRTEVAETLVLLEQAYQAVTEAKLLAAAEV
jgi:DNA invertase Pin-like site-specific DNA recombinase